MQKSLNSVLRHARSPPQRPHPTRVEALERQSQAAQALKARLEKRLEMALIKKQAWD
jgi:hypothetical protein